MKKILVILLSLMMVMTLMVGCGDNEQEEVKEDVTMTIRLSATLGTNHQLTMSAQEFADYVNEHSDTLTVEVYPSAQLYNDETMIEAIP